MHVETEQRHVRERRRQLSDTARVVERHTKLLSALAGADVLVCGINGNLWIHPDRDRRADASSCGDLVDEMQLHFGLDVDE